MADQVQQIMDTIQGEEYKEAFNKFAENGILDRDLAQEVLIEWGSMLDMDLGYAVNFYDLNKSDLPPEELRQKMDFDSFIGIFRKWLEKEQQAKQKPQSGSKQNTQQNQPQQDPYWFKSDGTQNTEQSDIRNQERLIQDIFETNEARTKKVFAEYAQLSNTGDSISKSDIPLLIKNLLYQQNASLYEKEGSEDYFQRSNTYKDLILEEDEVVPYEKFKEAAIHFIRNNPNLIVMDNQRAEQRKRDVSNHNGPNSKRNLEEELLEQIERYQQMMQQPNINPMDQRVIGNMISAIVNELDKLRGGQSIDQTNIQNNTTNLKKQLQISFSGIVRPEKKEKTRQEQEIIALDKKLQEIFVFFCKQQYVNGVAFDFDRYTKEAQTLSLGMFVYFCKSFDLIKKKVREVEDKNYLERRRRGENVPVPNEKSVIIDKKPDEPDKSTIQLEMVAKVPKQNKKYSKVPSKFEWWNDELKFEKYYNPSLQQLPQQVQDDAVFLTKDEIRNLFKRSAFGKDLDFEEFKCLLGLMANKMFFEKGERHPHAYQHLLTYINIHDPVEYRKRLIPIKIPFNCKEKMGFRELPGHEHHEYKIHKLSEMEQERLRQLKAEREGYLREKLSENPNQSLRSAVSVGSGAPKKIDYKQQQGRFLNGRIDLDREKISWAKLEHLNPHDISGNHGKIFKPQELIDDFEDEEDRFFLKEFSLEEEKKNQPKPEDVQRSLEKYGSYKPPLRPTQKAAHQQSQPVLSLNQRYQKQEELKNKYQQRANQVQKQQNNREKQLMDQINQKYKL